MSRVLALVLAGLAAAAALEAQQAPPQARREALQAQVLDRFFDRAAAQLRLDSAGRARLERALRTAAERRRALLREMQAARRELVRALADPATPDAEFERILDRLAALRAREFQLWREEQEELGRTLTPRQRAQLAVLLLRLNDRIQELRARGPAARPPGPAPRRP